MTAPNDWREAYIICEHIADGSAQLGLDTRAYRFRVCCAACYGIKDERGVARFFFEDLDETEVGSLVVGRLRS